MKTMFDSTKSICFRYWTFSTTHLVKNERKRCTNSKKAAYHL